MPEDGPSNILRRSKRLHSRAADGGGVGGATSALAGSAAGGEGPAGLDEDEHGGGMAAWLPDATAEEKAAWGIGCREYTKSKQLGTHKATIGFWAHIDHSKPPPPRDLLEYMQPGQDGSTSVDARVTLAGLAADGGAEADGEGTANDTRGAHLGCSTGAQAARVGVGLLRLRERGMHPARHQRGLELPTHDPPPPGGGHQPKLCRL